MSDSQQKGEEIAAQYADSQKKASELAQELVDDMTAARKLSGFKSGPAKEKFLDYIERVFSLKQHIDILGEEHNDLFDCIKETYSQIEISNGRLQNEIFVLTSKITDLQDTVSY